MEFLAEAERYKDPAALCTAYRILGTTCVTMGEFAAGLHHLERARAAVTKNIRAGVERIRRNDAKLGEHFAASIRTGAFCAYLPDFKGNLPWRT